MAASGKPSIITLRNQQGNKMRLKEFDRSHDTPDSSISLDPHRGDYEIRNYHKLDKYLAELCDLVERGQKSDKDFGMVAAGILTLKHPYMSRLNRPGKHGRIHAEHAVIEDFIKNYGSIPEGSIIITTLSPCNTPMDERDGPSCADLLNEYSIQKVYCGYIDPTQHDGAEDNRKYNLIETQNKELRTRCERFADTFLDKVYETVPDINYGIGKSPGKLIRVGKNGQVPHASLHVNVSKSKAKKLGLPHNIEENFADGRNPQDKGDSKRHHVPTKASVSSLRKFAKNHSGRAAQLAHWMANMKAGKKKNAGK
jgi:pyrimidine deaminase RibD-like protein